MFAIFGKLGATNVVAGDGKLVTVVVAWSGFVSVPEAEVDMDDIAKEVAVRTNERSEEIEMTAVGIEGEVRGDVGAASVLDVVALVGKLIVISVVGVLVIIGGDAVGEVLEGRSVLGSTTPPVLVLVVAGGRMTGGKILVTADTTGGRIPSDEDVWVGVLPLPEVVSVGAGGRITGGRILVTADMPEVVLVGAGGRMTGGKILVTADTTGGRIPSNEDVWVGVLPLPEVVSVSAGGRITGGRILLTADTPEVKSVGAGGRMTTVGKMLVTAGGRIPSNEDVWVGVLPLPEVVSVGAGGRITGGRMLLTADTTGERIPSGVGVGVLPAPKVMSGGRISP